MNPIDLLVLLGTLGFIVIYGTLKTRKQRGIDDYLRSGGNKHWGAICLSIMATQASAITFISTPGQAFESGMGFVQFYFGLPLAMIVISAVFIPIFYKLNVYTAYEYLEGRFNLRTRQFIALLFLLSRGLATGITIYAPAIILSTLLGWNLSLLCLLIGTLVVIYTYTGGEKAVSQTHMLQMTVIMSGMAAALVMLIKYLPAGVSLYDATYLAGKLGKMQVINTHFDASNRYNLWSGLIGGFFLSLSYFGTDQSQVSRYLGGASVRESRLGLFFNGILKIPMQFFILFIGVMTFVFYIFHSSPVFFNNKVLEKQVIPAYVQQQLNEKCRQHSITEQARKEIALELIKAKHTDSETTLIEHLQQLDKEDQQIRTDVKEIIKKELPNVETRDTDYVFLTFVLNNLPVGLVGLLLAVMFSAAMSSTSGQINSLASATAVDFYKRSINPNATETQYVRASKRCTLLWGFITVGFAMSASLFDNLIQAVNILGSLFYGTILGVFLVAFFFKQIKGNAVFVAALFSQSIIITLHFMGQYGLLKIAYLWYNLLGPLLVIGFSLLFKRLDSKTEA